jgi:hypothetical protein
MVFVHALDICQKAAAQTIANRLFLLVLTIGASLALYVEAL